MSVGNTQIFKKRKDGKMDTPFSPNCSLILTRSLPPTIPTVTFCSGTNRNFTYELGQKTAVRTSRSVFMKVNIVSSASCQKRTVSLKRVVVSGTPLCICGTSSRLTWRGTVSVPSTSKRASVRDVFCFLDIS
jgi:hypothetical protein